VNTSDEAVEGRINDIITAIGSGEYDSAKANCHRLLEDHFGDPSKTGSPRSAARIRRTARWCKTALRYLEAGWYAEALHAMESALNESQAPD
jgi:hypothetical protein